MKLPEPYQGLGSRLVVNLASRLMTALLPPGRSSFRLGVSAEALLASGQSAVPEDVEGALTLTERIITAEIERRSWRQPTNVTLQHLIVGGNALEQLLPDNTIRVYRIDQFRVVRDAAGKLIEFIICDPQDPEALSPNLDAVYQEDNGPSAGNTAYGVKTVDLYTWGVLEGDTWTVHQELGEKVVAGTKGIYKDDRLPFFALRWNAVAGEDYGRGKVEEHLPDLRTLDGLTMALIDGAGMASRNITLIRPNAAGGVNLRRKITRAKNGDYVIGNPEDVNMLQFQNSAGLQITQAEVAALRQELSSAFLLGQGTTRDAERVTATEIRMNAQELEAALGGVYSMLSHDMMARRLDRLIIQMQARQQLPNWPEKAVEPTILTGLEALGREAQVQNVVTAIEVVRQLPPDIIADYIKWPVMLGKGFNGLNLSDAVNTEQEAAAIRQQRMQMQTAQDAITNAAGPAAGALAQAATQQ